MVQHVERKAPQIHNLYVIVIKCTKNLLHSLYGLYADHQKRKSINVFMIYPNALCKTDQLCYELRCRSWAASPYIDLCKLPPKEDRSHMEIPTPDILASSVLSQGCDVSCTFLASCNWGADLGTVNTFTAIDEIFRQLYS
jgi:hypothetical protein